MIVFVFFSSFSLFLFICVGHWLLVVVGRWLLVVVVGCCWLLSSQLESVLLWEEEEALSLALLLCEDPSLECPFPLFA